MEDFYSKYFDQQVKSYKGNLEDIYFRESSGRNNFIKKVFQIMDIKPEEIILDAGCGVGNFIIPFSSRAKYVYAIDSSQESIKICEKRLAAKNISNVLTKVFSITNIPLKENSVDKILCCSILQYLTVPEIGLAIKEFSRVLKKNGALFIYFLNGDSPFGISLSAARFFRTIINGKKKYQLTYVSFRKLKKEIEQKIGPVEILDSQGFYLILCPRYLKILLSKIESSRFFQKVLGKYGLNLLIKARARK